ncbi:TonB-dependent receptor [uncultured Pedobacter sp.]|uniref:TonB-dependent receptor n=1 Tax=uncultured Pedobacter sp. TaxID=246139 RepID=UPI0025D36430|nr:carboxypeptidase regulatory-like domain-containing protein [uncultured Pedobacter sp.]
MRLLLVFLVLAGFGCAAQTTRTSLSGLIRTAGGAAVNNASVTLIHLPSNTVYGCASNLSGGYLISDVKPGGPYRFEVSSLGFKSYRLDRLFFKLEDEISLNVMLGEDIRMLDDVQVSAGSGDILFDPNNRSTLFNINQARIRLLPSVKRSITDFTRLSPYAFGAAVAGGNYRQNFITIDGSEFNNNFGVGDNLPGNGAQPIALDAIAEISLNLAPYSSIWESGFIGSTINIITRSGNNKMQGAVYSYFKNQDSYGRKVGGNTLEKRPVQYLLNGFRLGGPILKNRLFYFVSFETEREVYQPQTFRAATGESPYGTSVNTARPGATALDSISSYLYANYGYETGSYQGYDFTNSSQKFLIRADWNIAGNSRLTVRYNQLNSLKPELLNGSRSPLTPFAAGTGRRNLNALPFSNSNFTTRSGFYSLSLEWDSKLSTHLDNTLRASYTGQQELRLSDSKPFPFVDILKDGIPFTSFGYEPFSYQNKRSVALVSLSNVLHWKPRQNSWDAGFQADYIRTGNRYMPFGTGYYTFSSWSDFAEGKKPVDYAVTYPTGQDKNPPLYDFDYFNLSAFAQHNMVLGKYTVLNLGLRGDLSLYPKQLPQNQELSELVFSSGTQVNTRQLPQPQILLSPRASLKYDVFNNHLLQLKLGTGIFTGRIPFVWVISQARYSGVGQVSQTWQGQLNTPHPFEADFQHSFATGQSEPLPSVSSVLSGDFKMPQTWKTSIGARATLPGGISLQVDAVYNRDIRSIAFSDINLVEPSRLNITDYPDHRWVYPQKNQAKYINTLNSNGKADPKGTSALNMVSISNLSGGSYFSALFAVSKSFRRGPDFSFSYIRSVARNYNDGDGDQTLSALNATPTVNGINHPALSYAGYIVPDRIVSTVTWPLVFNKHLTVNFGLLYQGSSEGRFSYTYARDLVGDGTNRSLIYVPENPSEISFEPLKVLLNGNQVVYSSEAQRKAFFDYIAQDAYLNKRKGNYAERNGALFPWRHLFDLHFSAEFTINPKKNKNRIETSIDVLNVGNLIYKNWGLKKLINASAILIPVNLDMISANGTTPPKFNLANVGGRLVSETFRPDYSVNSTYLFQIGLRYTFD